MPKASQERKVCQFKKGKILEGSQAFYRIDKMVRPTGFRAQTYKATISSIKKEGHYPIKLSLLQPGSPVIIKVVNIDPNRLEASIVDILFKVNYQLGREFNALRHLTGLNCAAKQIDIGTVNLDIKIRGDTRATFVVQEFIQGLRLDEFLVKEYGCLTKGSKNKRFCGIPKEKAWFAFSKKLTHALLSVHKSGIVHQDIWPKNIMIRENTDEPVFIDFGEAIFRDYIPPHEPRDIYYKHTYIPPEWIKRRRSWPSRRSELYSFACVLFYMASGEDPPKFFGKSDKQIKDRIIEAICRDNSALLNENPGIPDILVPCLRPERENRVPDAESFLQKIETFSLDEGDSNLSGILEHLNRSVGNLRGPANAFFTRLAEFDLRRLENRIADMKEGVLDISGDREEIEWSLTQYLSVLKKGEEYLTISTPQFWTKANLGVVGPYLTMNRLLAQRGVMVKRLFLLTKSDLNPSNSGEDSVYSIIKAHQLMQDDFKRIHRRLGIETRYYPVETNKKRKEMIRDGEHNGIWISEQDALELFLIYDEKKKLRTVRLRRVERAIEQRRDIFYSLFGQGKAIREWLEKYESNRTRVSRLTKRGLKAAKLFYSYSRQNETMREKLEKHLSALRREGILSEWHDRDIRAGDDWKKEIDQHLASSDIILLLLSADFMNSDYCINVEMKKALELNASGRAIVIPVILEPCDWKIEVLRDLQALPKDGKPISRWSNKNEAFRNVAEGIRKALKRSERQG